MTDPKRIPVVEVSKIKGTRVNDDGTVIQMRADLSGDEIVLEFRSADIESIIPSLVSHMLERKDYRGATFQSTKTDIVTRDDGRVIMVFHCKGIPPIPIEVGPHGLVAIRDGIGQLLGQAQNPAGRPN